MASIDVASTVGTWVAAGLAIVAIFGIIGPWLLWRNLRSERTLAINDVDDPKHQFISAGLRTWGGARILRRVRVPNLMDPPEFTAKREYPRIDAQLLEPPSRTGWVMFAQGLRAFSIKVEQIGNLVIRDREAWLPVHKLWILAFGLLTRLGHREDKAQAVILSSGWRLDHDADRENPEDIFGSLGVLRHISPSSSGEFNKVFLTPYSSELRGNLKPDALPLSTLFWLSVACLPLGDSRVYDLSSPTSRPRYRTQANYDNGEPASVPLSSSDPTGALEDSHDQSEDQPISERLNMLPQVPNIGGPRIGDNLVFEDPLIMPSGRLLRFKPLTNVVTSSRYGVWAHAMGCNLNHVLTLEEVPSESLEPAEIDDLNFTLMGDKKSGYSSKSSWICLDGFANLPALGDYIWKSDLQCLALALLLIPWSPRHFLSASHRGEFGFDLLRSASRDDGKFLVRAISRMVQHWNIPTDRGLLVQAMAKASEAWGAKSGFSRTRSQAFYDVDVLLQHVYPGSSALRLTIGILYITSDKFRKFLWDMTGDGLRAKDFLVEIDMKANVVRTSSPMHKLVEHRLVFGDVFPQEHLSASNPKTALSVEEVMLAALQAWTRSSWLALTLDSTPLQELVESFDEVVYMASRSQPPMRHLPRRTSDTPTRWTQIDRLQNVLEDLLDARLPVPRSEIPYPQSRGRRHHSRSRSRTHSRSTSALVQYGKDSGFFDGPPTRAKSLDFAKPIPDYEYMDMLHSSDYFRLVTNEFHILSLPDIANLWWKWDDYLRERMRQTGRLSGMRAMDRQTAQGKKVIRERITLQGKAGGGKTDATAGQWARLGHVHRAFNKDTILPYHIGKLTGLNTMSDSGEVDPGEIVPWKFPNIYQANNRAQFHVDREEWSRWGTNTLDSLFS